MEGRPHAVGQLTGATVSSSNLPEATISSALSRRRFLRYTGALGALVGVDSLLPGWAHAHGLPPRTAPGVLDGSAGPIELTIGRTEVGIDGRGGTAITLNGTIPGPLIRFREGDEAIIHVTNTLDEDTSIHWHGLILPNGMDGVPKVNFPGIRPGETFTYRYPIQQFGTYWYHSHSGLQEQLGHYGPMVIDPARPEPQPYDREHVIVLSDWTFENPYRLMAKLKKHPDYYNFNKRTVFDFFRDASEEGVGRALDDRLSWGRMRMNPTDISDITSATLTYLCNGLAPDDNWTGLFEPGERVRLRFINAAAATYFDVRVPGLPMTVIQMDGQHVRPVETDEFRLPPAKTYDVIVEPREDRAYTVFAESIARGGHTRGTLAPREGMEAEVPPARERPLLTMADMGMAGHMGHDMGGMEEGSQMGVTDPMAGMDHSMHQMAAPDSAMSADSMPADTVRAAGAMAGHDHAAMAGGEAMGGVSALRPPGTLPEDSMHGEDEHGAGNAGVAMMATSRLHEPGIGLGEDGWRVLRYTDLEALEPWPDFRAPDREIELHLTGNMERFMWSIDGVEFTDAEPIRVEYGERIRLTMINDTMMNHPMHLHGMWMELENGKGDRIPRVHTINVKPAEKVSLLFNADALGPWAFHCHILYHMDAGMFRVVEVVEPEGGMGHHMHRGQDDEGGER